jgi:hypothetical protein
LKGEAAGCAVVYGVTVRETVWEIAQQRLEIRKSVKVRENIGYFAYFFCKECMNVRSNMEILGTSLAVITVILKQVIVVGFIVLVSKINYLDELCELRIFHYVEEGGSAVFVLGENEDAKGMGRCKAFERFAYEATREKIVVVTAVREFIQN